MSVAKTSYVDTDVRVLFEKHTIEETRSIHRKVNHEIERKKEELRMLVGERYRDLIDAADTIGTMKKSSTTVFNKLSSLRSKLSSLPAHLTLSSSALSQKVQETEQIKLSKAELEIAAELKLSLEIPRQVQHCLENEQLLQAFHFCLLFSTKLTSKGKGYKWTFLQNSGQDLDQTSLAIVDSLLTWCNEAMENIETSPQKLSECIIIKENLTKLSCEKILSDWLLRRVQMCYSLLKDKDPEFIQILASTVRALYQIFIDPELYNSTAKNVRKPNVNLKNLCFIFQPKCVDEFINESIPVENPPRASKLAEIILQSFINPLKTLLESSYVEAGYLQDLDTLMNMNEYRQSTTKILIQDCEELMRIVLGTSTTLWLHVFAPVFQLKAQAVVSYSVEEILRFLRNDGFPKFESADSHFDLVNFIWKASAVSENATLEEDLKIKCLTPNVSQLCWDLETRFQDLLTDFQSLGDASLKEFISAQLLSSLKKFIQEGTVVHNSTEEVIGSESKSDWFLGRFSTALIELCPALWKLLEKEDAIKLKQCLHVQSEKCWTDWSDVLLKSFESKLGDRMSSLSPETVSVFMPIGEVYKSEADDEQENFEPSVRIPLQLSHILHTLLFSICLEIAKVGPQSIPKNVKDSLRLAFGQSVIKFYEKFLKKEEPEEAASHVLTSQMAVQFIFDLRFVQWFHPNLSGNTDSLVLELKSLIDPFDWDIVNPRLTVNLKRFLFENHLTLGLLFSEESHGFIAQNFKTRQNQSYPSAVRNLLYNQLPLLPV